MICCAASYRRGAEAGSATPIHLQSSQGMRVGNPPQADRTGLADALLVWALFGIVAIEVFATYARTPVQELYRVRTGGLEQGAGRALAFIGYPVGLAALAVIPLTVDRLRQRATTIAAVAALALAAAVLWPGALDESGLEAPPARLLAAVGVALALALTLAAWRTRGSGLLGHEPGDRVRFVVAAALLAIGLPWMAADLGLSLDRVPILKSVYVTDQLALQPSRVGLHPAVHDGHHHGMDGVLLVWTALLVSRTLRHLRRARVRVALTIYVAFLLVYGAANAIQDAWLEQIVKRGWSTYELPTMVVPAASAAWLVIVALAGGFSFLLLRTARASA